MMVPAEAPAAAVSRVVNTMRGRKAGQEADDDDDDDDLLISNTVISLKDPLSGTRIQIAARSADTRHVSLCCHITVTLYSYAAFIQLSHCCHAPVALLSCDSYTALMQLLHCYHAVVSLLSCNRCTALLHCSAIAARSGLSQQLPLQFLTLFAVVCFPVFAFYLTFCDSCQQQIAVCFEH